MAKLGKLKMLLVSQETNPGEAVAGATQVLGFDPVIDPDDNLIPREPTSGFGGPALAVRGPQTGTARFRCELRSNGTTGLDAGLAILLQACGLKITSTVYAPVTAIASQKTATIDCYVDGLLKRLFGAMGTFTLSGEFGKQVFIEFTFTGLFAMQADTALPAASFGAPVPMLAKSCTFTLGSYPAKISRFSITANNPVEPREDVTAAQGIGYYLVGSGRRYTIEIDPEVQTTAEWDVYTLWTAGTLGALVLVISDGTTKLTVGAPKVQISPPQEGTRGSRLIHNLTGICTQNAGDDEITLTPAAVA